MSGNVALEFIRNFHFQLHDWFEQTNLSLLQRFTHAIERTDVERHFGRVNIVVATVLQNHLHIHHFTFTQRTLDQGSLETFVDRLDVFLGNTSTRDVVDEFIRNCAVFRQRNQFAHNVTELARTPGLLLVLVVELDFACRGFPIGDARVPYDALNTVFSLDSLNIDVQVQLTHPCNQGLASFFVRQNSERRIFTAESLQSLSELISPVTLCWFDAESDHGIRHEDTFQ